MSSNQVRADELTVLTTNTKTEKVLGIEVPTSLLLRAYELIE
jgi:hypothetical protein